MQAAKDAVKKFTSKDGHHDTTVHEKVAPAVTNETVSRQQEDRVQTAIDREVHQDHYHTSVQPVKHSEVLPEQHHHKMGNVEHRHFEHDDHSRNKERLATEAAKFKDQSTRVEGGHTTTEKPSVAGEHVHHHVHETIQPVVHKQTVEPHVVHNTIPVHEVHHNAAQHHSTSALEPVSMDEFKSQGGALGGRGERSDAFTGEPKHVGGALSGHHSGSHHSGAHQSGVGSTTGTGLNSNTAGTTGTSTGLNSRTTGTTGSSNATGAGAGAVGGAGVVGSDVSGAQGLGKNDSRDSNNSNSKPSLMDKLNPKTDADGDGKTGFMS